MNYLVDPRTVSGYVLSRNYSINSENTQVRLNAIEYALVELKLTSENIEHLMKNSKFISECLNRIYFMEN